MAHAPLLTPLLGLMAVLLAQLSPAAHEALYFNIERLAGGEWHGLVSGHWIHADTQHLLWNVSALVLLGAIIEAYSRRLLAISLLVGTLFVDLLLVSPLADVTRYCGLSGLLNTLLGVALYLFWRRTHSQTVVLVGALSLLKIAIEIILSQSLFTNTSWPPFALAHLAGMAGVPVALFLHYRSGHCLQPASGNPTKNPTRRQLT